MAANLDKFEKSLDRLERLFSSKRGRSSSTREIFSRLNKNQQHNHRLTSPSPPPQPQPEPETQTFPSPSFLRPTTTRMLARDEVKVKVRSPRRAQSLPETPNSHDRMPSIDESIAATISSFPTSTAFPSLPRVPRRSSSLLQRRRDPSIAGLLEFSFREKHTWTRNDSISSSGTDPASPRRKSSLNQADKYNQLQEALPIFSARRPDTPPYSDSSNCTSPSPTHFNKPLPAPPRFSGVFSPEASPERRSFISNNPIYNESNYWKIPKMAKSQKHRSLEELELLLAGPVSLRKTVSDSTLQKTVPTTNPAQPAERDLFLEEPTVETFLGLSDDDIADGPPVTPPPSSSARFERERGRSGGGESGRFVGTGGSATSRGRLAGPSSRTSSSGRAPTFDLPPDPPVFHMPSPRSGSRRTSPLISLSSVLTSRPSKAGAFECRRIAERYDFDLIYIVNLWPLDLVSSTPQQQPASIPRPGESFGSPTQAVGQRRGRTRTYSPSPYRTAKPTMTGRLLAGHNLATVQTPFLISPDVHQKVLRQDGWLEYRSERTRPDEFSRGYSCAFYAGYGSSDNNQPSTSTSASASASTSTTTTKPRSHSGSGAAASSSTLMSLSEKRRSQQLKNRGIVFAAYRLPRGELDGATPGSDAAQLAALHREAETLVEMLLDIHKTSRSRAADHTFAATGTGTGIGTGTGKGGGGGVGGGGGGLGDVVDDEDPGPLPVRQKYEPYC